MLHVAFQPHWLEEAIGSSRSPNEISQAIAVRPEFRKLIEDAIAASESERDSSKQARLIAEVVISKLFHSIDFSLAR